MDADNDVFGQAARINEITETGDVIAAQLRAVARTLDNRTLKQHINRLLTQWQTVAHRR